MILRSKTSRRRRGDSRFAPLSATLTSALQALAGGLLQPTVILASIAFLFGGSAYQVAAFTTAAVVAWALAPLAMSLMQGATSRTDIIVFAASMASVIAVLTIGLAAFRIDHLSTERFLELLIGGFVVNQVALALVGQAKSSLIAGSFPGNVAQRIFRNSRILATGAALVAGLVGWSVFDSGLPFQQSVRQILLLAVLAVLAATWFLFQQQTGRPSPLRFVHAPSMPQILGSVRVPAFRRFLSYKVLLAAAAAVDPFLIVFGFQELGLEVSYLGLALFSVAAGHVVGAVVWPRWMAGRGPRVPFQLAALFRLALLLWIVAVPGIASSSLYTDRFDDGTAAMRGFAVGFALLGLASSAGGAGNQRYLMAITRTEALPGATMASNLVMAIVGFGPLVVARLLDDVSLERMLWGAAVCAGLALIASGLLVESSVRVKSPVGSWRATRQATNSV
ncbi:MAG TPA: hypothetical protein VD767_05705 [Thermomicrobiales bacterium]|nr:hypothetical protein [Thermomicrobiales bacterium]